MAVNTTRAQAWKTLLTNATVSSSTPYSWWDTSTDPIYRVYDAGPLSGEVVRMSYSDWTDATHVVMSDETLCGLLLELNTTAVPGSTISVQVNGKTYEVQLIEGLPYGLMMLATREVNQSVFGPTNKAYITYIAGNSTTFTPLDKSAWDSFKVWDSQTTYWDNGSGRGRSP